MSIIATPGFPPYKDPLPCYHHSLFGVCCPESVIKYNEEHRKSHPDHFERCGWCFYYRCICECDFPWKGHCYKIAK